MSLNFTDRVPCPVCKSEEAVKVRNIGDIVTCSSCELTYLRTRPSVKDLEAEYQRYASTPGSHMHLPATFQELKATGLRRNEVMSDVIAFTGENRRKLLDIGSGYGAFLMNARDHGFTVEGCELCAEMADFAWKMLGIRTHSQQLESCNIPSESFQVVTLIHSLEHLPHTADALSFIHRILEPNGLIAGIVPNFGSWASQTHKDNWKWIDPVVHMVHFTPDTLQKTLWRFGFQVQKSYTTCGDYDRRQLPPPAVLKRIEAEGHGEEIRFFATKL